MTNINMRVENSFTLNTLGRGRDPSAYNSSDLSWKIMNNLWHDFPKGSYFLGDSAYPTSANLVTPIPKSECLWDHRKRLFN